MPKEKHVCRNIKRTNSQSEKVILIFIMFNLYCLKLLLHYGDVLSLYVSDLFSDTNIRPDFLDTNVECNLLETGFNALKAFSY